MHFEHNISLKNLNSFGIEAKAKHFVNITKSEDLTAIRDELRKEKLLILGGGSNMLFTQDFDGLVVKMSIDGITVLNGDPQHIYIKAGAGVIWNDFVLHCVTNNWAGVENLTLIPGSVGAAPVQNIGAYGVELKDIFHSCTAYEIESATTQTFNNEECKFGYRESIFKQEAKGKYIITEVVFKLNKTALIKSSYGAIQDELNALGIQNPSIHDISKVVAKIRVSKLPDPKTIGNAGSFFKNPIINQTKLLEIQAQYTDIVYYPINENEVKLAAGWLIEQCGWKGKMVGNTGTWKNQALVLVNHGNASGHEIWALASEIITSVQHKFGVSLSPEVNII